MTPRTLRRFSAEHLRYEIGMFVETATVLAQIMPTQVPKVIKNALVESFAIHVRNLIEFLYLPANPKSDDVTADHYVDNIPAWHAARGKMPKDLVRAKRRANKQIAHLTRARYQGQARQKQWNLLRLRDLLVPRLKKFARHASPRKIAPVVRSLIESL